MSLEILIIFLIFLFSYFLVLRNLRMALNLLLLLSVFLHKELFSIYQWNFMPVRAFMVGMFCAGVTHAYFWFMRGRDKKKLLDIIKNPYLILVVTLWFVRGLSIIFSKNLQESLKLFGFFSTILVLIAFLFHQFKGKPMEIIKYLKYYIYIAFGLTIFGYIQYFIYSKTGVIIGAFWNIPGNIARVGATFWDVNHYAALLGALLPILGVLIITSKKPKSIALYSLMFVSMISTLFLTSSRTAWILDLVALLVFVSMLFIRKWGIKGLAWIFGLILLVTIPVVREYSIKDSPFRARIKQYFHYRMDSFNSHLMLLTGTYQIFEKFPIIGGGYGSFFEHFSKTEIAPEFFGRDPAALNTRVPAHTIWGELLAETGALGLFIFVLFSLLVLSVLAYCSMKVINKREQLLATAMFSAVVGWLVAGVFYSYNAEFFWILLTLFFIYGVSVLKDRYSLGTIIGYFTRSNKFDLGILFLISFGLILVGLGLNHLVPWDEAIYAKVAKNMVVKGEYLAQYWNPQSYWYEKPPVYMWCMALLMKILGFNSWASKLPSALFGISTIYLVYYFGKKLFSRVGAFVASFTLLTTIHFLYYSRMAMTDVTATFFISLSLFLYYLARSESKRNLWIFSGISLGIAVMTKGVIGLLPVPIIVLYELYLIFSNQQKFSRETVRGPLTILLFGSIVFLPWHLYMYARFGNEFLFQYLGYHVVARAIYSIEDKGKPLLWYLVVMRVSMRIWLLVLIASVPFVFKRVIKRDNRYVFLLISSLFMFTFFSVAKSKLIWYIIPIYPLLSLVNGSFIDEAFKYALNLFKINNVVTRFLVIFVLVSFSLTYLFVNKKLVYPGDLTGPKARLLQLKDEKLGTESMFYVDRIEQPLVMFYTDSPFEIIDFHALKLDRIPFVMYDEEMIILGKRGRYMKKSPYINREPKIVGEENDWILWYYESEYEKDLERLDKIEKRLKKSGREAGGNPETQELLVEQDEIITRMNILLKGV